jgi:tRNA(Ile)-lysidine synthase
MFGEDAPAQVARTSDLVRAYLEAEILPTLEHELDRWTRRAGADWILELADVRSRPAVWRRHLILTILERGFPEAPRSEATAREIDALVDAQVGRRVECGSSVIWRERGRLYFEQRDPDGIRAPSEMPAEDEALSEQALHPESAVSVPGGGRLTASGVEERAGPVGKGDGASGPSETGAGKTGSSKTGSRGAGEAAGGRAPQTERLDADRIAWPLRVRPWRAGDRVQPLGMEGHRPVSDLLTDRKIPPHERDRVAVLVSGGEIVWVLGVQLAHPARIREETDRTVTLRYEP